MDEIGTSDIEDSGSTHSPRRRGERDGIPTKCPSGSTLRAIFHTSLALLTFLSLLFHSRAQSLNYDDDDLSAQPAEEWPTSGGDWSNRRYSGLALINTQNVEGMGAAWVSEEFEEGGTSRVTPIMRDGLMFVTAGRRVYALDAETGQKVWDYKTVADTRIHRSTSGSGNIATTTRSPNAPPNERGVAVGQGLVFVGLRDGSVIALKEKTGELIWVQQTGIHPPKKGQMAAVSPTYSNGVVFSGLGNGDAQLIGRLTALDASTGRILWHWNSVPAPGEPGHETWPSSEIWRTGGGGVWTSPAVDTKLGLVYVTTGNPVPASAGDIRPGDNLYTCSVVAIDIRTGKLRWFFQLVHHDVFDADAGTPVVLYDAKIKGARRSALAVVRADGFLFQLDRETGEPLLPIRELPVPQAEAQATSATQPFPVGGDSILMSCDEWRKQLIPSGFVLGCMWTPPSSPFPSKEAPNVLSPLATVRVSPTAYNPSTKHLYVQGISTLTWARRAHDPFFFPAYGKVPGLKSFGELAAIDTRTGRIAWRQRTIASFPPGGILATAGRLLFLSAADGHFEARDNRTGDLLWKYQTGWEGARGSPITYKIRGQQYVAVPAGNAIWAFKLGGKRPPPAPPTPLEPQEAFRGPIVDVDTIQTTALRSSGTRYFIDEYEFNPYRARVNPQEDVLFVNNGNIRHEIVAVDDSWGTGPLGPAQEARIRFPKPGEYVYRCKDHPWSYGQVIVSPPPLIKRNGIEGTDVIDLATYPAMRDKQRYDKHCSGCHGEDLTGLAPAPPLSGDAFLRQWRSANANDLFKRIRTTMPPTSPGHLDDRTYIQIVAHILRVNSVYAGEPPLGDDPQALENIDFGRKN